MAFQLQKQEPVTPGLRRLVKALLIRAGEELSSSTLDRDKAIHNTRKSCKRIRAVLRLLRPVVGDTVYRVENAWFRDTGQLLAGARDAAVLISALDALSTPAVSFPQLRARLVARYTAGQQQQSQDTGTIPTVINRLQLAQQRWDDWSWPVAELDVLAGSLAAVYRRGHAAMLAAYAQGSPHLFHDWRKQVKYLWHGVEVLQGAWSPVLPELTAQLHLLSDYLGDDHDLFVLQQVAQAETEADTAQASALPAEMAPLGQRIAQRQAELRALAYSLGQRIYAESPYAFGQRLTVYWQTWGRELVEPERPPTPSLADRLLTTQQVANRLGISPQQVRERIRAGQLSGLKIGGVWIMDALELSPAAGDGSG